MKQNIILVLSSIIFVFLMAIFGEFCIRFLFPDINYQGTQRSLYKERSFGNSMGWEPNESGVSFGKLINIDSHGFRKMTAPAHYNTSWIILGDSVGFGVGVDTEKTFAGLLQDRYENIKIWNTSVVGYSIPHYKDVLDSFLLNRDDINKVLLFFCLNDIYVNLDLAPQNDTVKEKTFLFLRRKSKLYMLFKNMFSDRSKTYTLHDIGLYRDGNPQLMKSLGIIADMKSVLEKKNIEFTVIILPYEFQIRMKKEEYNLPQKLLPTYFNKNDINVINVYDHFVENGNESKKYFLYADPSHLSELGHQIVFHAISGFLED